MFLDAATDEFLLDVLDYVRDNLLVNRRLNQRC